VRIESSMPRFTLRRLVDLLVPPSRRRWYGVVLSVLFLIKAPWVWLYRQDGYALLAGGEAEDFLERRRYLLRKLRILSLDDMPALLPDQFKGEWMVGTLSMSAAALVNLALRFPETRDESIEVLHGIIRRMEASDARAFDRHRWGVDPIDSLEGPGAHIGYLGHLAWILSGFRTLSADTRYDDLYRRVAAALSRHVAAVPGRCAETYPGEVYLPDNLVVYASLRRADLLFGTDFGAPVDRWVDKVAATQMDPENGLLPFRLRDDCTPLTRGRGSGAGWNAFYLPFVDRALARSQMIRLRDTLFSRAIGVFPGIREYPRGTFGLGDVDSGPVILGLSPSGTGFALSTAVYLGDAAMLHALLFTAEVVGTTVEAGDERWYLTAPLVGEAIVLAMKSAVIWPPPVR
jgi:hypothetical protein